MSKCNLLKPLELNTGTFYMFSQYGEDITREQTEKDTYRVTPARFWALNLKTEGLGGQADKNVVLGEIFQNYYENMCAYFRVDDDFNSIYPWKSEYARHFLLQTLTKHKLINVTYNNNMLPVIDELNYIGDINIYAHNTIDGTGYNEIYCLLPDSAKRTIYELDSNTEADRHLLKYKYTNIVGYEDYTEDPFVNGLSLKAITDTDDKFYEVFDNRFDFNSEKIKSKPVDDESFDVNAIIVFYDIEAKDANGNKTILHRDIPMGIYFTGNIGADLNISNHITKYVANKDIFGQGTSYGLRICTRYLTTANLTMMQDTQVEEITDYAAFAQVMSDISESQKLMEASTKNTIDIFQHLKEHTANFKNNKVNVPYPRKISGRWYWFVNGKNTGVEVHTNIDEEFLKAYQTKYTTNIETNNKTIEGAINELNDNINDLEKFINEGGLGAEYHYVTLMELKSEGKLKIGQKYLLDDYEFIPDPNQDIITTGGWRFSLILTAKTNNSFFEDVLASPAKNTDHFSKSVMSNWKLRYCIDNDTDRFSWAHPEGKGVIYYMIDEFGNEAPYDFKNVKFKYDGKDIYTFNKYYSGQNYDLSLNTDVNGRYIKDIVCKNNIIKPCFTYDADNKPDSKLDKQILNNITFNYKSKSVYYCKNNYFEPDCSDIHFADNAYDNKFEAGCYDITFLMGAVNNTFGGNSYDNHFKNNAEGNQFGYENKWHEWEDDCKYNILESYCQNIHFKEGCSYNKFASHCHHCNFGEGCTNNTFGNVCYDIHIGAGSNDNIFLNGCDNIYLLSSKGTKENPDVVPSAACDKNQFGNNCHDILIKYQSSGNYFGTHCGELTIDKYCKNNYFNSEFIFSNITNNVENCIVETGIKYINIIAADGRKYNDIIQNNTFVQGLKGSSEQNKLDITINQFNQDFRVNYAHNSQGELKVYCEADLIK